MLEPISRAPNRHQIAVEQNDERLGGVANVCSRDAVAEVDVAATLGGENDVAGRVVHRHVPHHVCVGRSTERVGGHDVAIGIVFHQDPVGEAHRGRGEGRRRRVVEPQASALERAREVELVVRRMRLGLDTKAVHRRNGPDKRRTVAARGQPLRIAHRVDTRPMTSLLPLVSSHGSGPSWERWGSSDTRGTVRLPVMPWV